MAVEERETTTEEEVAPALSVSAAMGLAKNALEEVVVRLVGEVSEVNDKPGYKAVYFTVKDEKASLPCMMWMNRYQASGVALSVGALVELTGPPRERRRTGCGPEDSACAGFAARRGRRRRAAR